MRLLSRMDRWPWQEGPQERGEVPRQSHRRLYFDIPMPEVQQDIQGHATWRCTAVGRHDIPGARGIQEIRIQGEQAIRQDNKTMNYIVLKAVIKHQKEIIKDLRKQIKKLKKENKQLRKCPVCD